jgi:hypothetical protein
MRMHESDDQHRRPPGLWRPATSAISLLIIDSVQMCDRSVEAVFYHISATSVIPPPQICNYFVNQRPISKYTIDFGVHS